MRQAFNDIKTYLIFLLCTVIVGSVQAQSDWISKLRELREKGQPAARLEFIDKTLTTANPTDRPLLLMEKGQILTALKQNPQALAAYDEVLKNPGSMAEYAHLFMARIYLEGGQTEEAKKHFSQILKLMPNLQLQNEAKLELARMALKEGKASEASHLLAGMERHLRGESIYTRFLWELARSEHELGHNTAVCKWLKKLFVQHPDFEMIRDWGSNLYMQPFEGSATRCVSSNEDRSKRIKNLQLAGLSQKAYAEIQEIKSSLGKDSYEATLLEALYHLHESEVSEALNLLLPFYDKKKNDFNYLTTLATTAARAGELPLSVGSYYASYRLSPRSKLGKQALYQAAFLSYQFQDYDGAARRFQEFMKVYSNSGLAKDARWHLAWIRYLRGDYDGAYAAFNDLKQLSYKRHRRNSAPANLDRISYWMAMSQFRRGEYAGARASFESIAKSGGQGYYGMAARSRIKRIDSILPKPMRPVLSDQTHRLSRFSATELMVSEDDFDGDQWSLSMPTEENESEENIALNVLSSGGNEAAATDDNDDDDKEATTTAEVATTDSIESKSSFRDPTLLKRFERARDLMILGLNEWAKWDLYDIERHTSNKEYLKTLMSEYEKIEQFHRSSTIAQNSFSNLRTQYGVEGVKTIWQHAYPQAYKGSVTKWSNEFQVGSELIWGIMRAESTYKRDAVSPVGALGLMQIMPSTGQKISGLLHDKDFAANKLLESDFAIRLGGKYLQRLMKQFDQNMALVAAGYNAGPHRVRSWLAAFGQLDLDEFIEHIPFLETRNYVKKVLSNASIYNDLYGSSKDFFPLLSEPLKIHFQNLQQTKETWEDI